MIWIIGGTSEAVEFVKRIRDKEKYVVTAATVSEREFLEDEHLIIGRMDEKSMEKFITGYSIDTVLDMSHPYAVEVTKNAKEASKKCKVKYKRYERPKTKVKYKNCIYVNSVEACMEYLKSLGKIKGSVFFTTGSKNIKDFETIRGNNRFIYRVLPAVESIKFCRESKVKMKDIIAVLGPFSEEINMALFKEYAAKIVVMKDSGKLGGTVEKLEACRKLDITGIVIER
ncbi:MULTISPECIES: precorrin-6A reductase [Clostridium]|uniref:precorrin-6A reductase n=1 Tax=Clostridium TaxID=1485 RepID=UPI00069FA531|nr:MULTISPECIES: precorrin-6A reductase [Clostridium]KOF57094.1 precorrin-6x reductase [Clostridium sp. DMHC 10]MCD2348500.1 precorrin-6A reductase [Clostridium guangxiense]